MSSRVPVTASYSLRASKCKREFKYAVWVMIVRSWLSPLWGSWREMAVSVCMRRHCMPYAKLQPNSLAFIFESDVFVPLIIYFDLHLDCRNCNLSELSRTLQLWKPLSFLYIVKLNIMLDSRTWMYFNNQDFYDYHMLSLLQVFALPGTLNLMLLFRIPYAY